LIGKNREVVGAVCGILNPVNRESPGLLRGDPRLKALRKRSGWQRFTTEA
jgi:hypothetical protein